MRTSRVVAGVLTIAVAGGIALTPLAAGASSDHPRDRVASSATVVERKVATYGEILTTSGGRTLYLLTSESSGKLHCTGSACLATWPPLYVSKGAKITKGAGVKGAVGHIVRGSKWQVTFNKWPVYKYAGDSKAGQVNGEGIQANGGTWYSVHATATTHSGTPDK